MNTLIQDLKFGLRMLAKDPGYTAVAVLTLALGIGANTAIFSVVDAVLLRPAPFSDPNRLVFVWTSNPTHGFPQLPFSYPNFTDMKNQSTAFAETAVFYSYTNTTFNLRGKDEPERVQAAFVSASLFPLLGVRPFRGRTFLLEDDRPGSNPVVIISRGLWERALGADPAMVGKPLTLDGTSYTVVGIMPGDFKFPRFPRDAEVWLPLSLDPVPGRHFSRGTKYLTMLARLAPNVSLDQAQTETGVIARRLAKADPVNSGIEIQLVPLPRQAVGNLRNALIVLLGAVCFVLLIACANVANLLLARASRRQREIAVRSALGAGRQRLIRQFFTECLLLAVFGGALGLLVADWGVGLLSAVPYNAPSYFKPYAISSDQIGIDARVFAFAALLTLGTAVIFGLVPALRATKVSLSDSLREGTERLSSGRRHRRTSDLLVITEVALATVLFVGAGLMVRSFLGLQSVDTGFRPENVLVAEINLPRSRYSTNQQALSFCQDLLERVKAMPGVNSAAVIDDVPLSGSDEDTGVFIEGQPLPAPGEALHAHPRSVSPDYFQTMGVPLLAGRFFTDQDIDGAPRVAIINQAMARRFWPNENPLGKRVSLDYEAMRFFPDRSPEIDLQAGLREVVGVVGDVRHQGLNVDPQPELYTPQNQRPSLNMSLVVHAASGPEALTGAIRQAVLAIDKDQPVSGARTMTQLLAESTAQPRFTTTLVGAFAGLALVLAAMGIYGVMAYTVSQRAHEFGIHMALGARQTDVLRMVMGKGLMVTLVGVGLGIAAALALARFLASMLYGVRPVDPLTFFVAPVLLTAVSLLACYIPARRATKVDPMVALRYE